MICYSMTEYLISVQKNFILWNVFLLWNEFKPKDLIIYIYIFSIILVQFLNQNGLYRMNELFRVQT